MALNFQGLLDNVKKAADWYVKNTPLYQTANAVNNQVQSGGGWNAGLDRAINDVKTNPSRYFIGAGLSPYIAPSVERGLTPLVGQETAGNIGQFTQGAANATGILNPNLYGGETQRTADLYRPISQQQQFARDAGTFTAGSFITAPLSGGSTLMRLAAIGKNALIGGLFGAGSATVSSAMQGRLPTQQELAQGAYEGAKNSWVYPATNRLTDIGLRQLAARVPAVASKVLPFTDEALNASKVATKNIATNGLREFIPAATKQIAKSSIREATETPLETAYFAMADPTGGDTYLERYKNRFIPDLISNAVIGAGRSAVGLTPSGVKAGYTDLKTAADANSQGIPAYLMNQKAPGFIDPKATVGDMQDSVERPLLNKFVEAQRNGDLAGMEAVVKAEESDPSYADYASMHRGYLDRLLKTNNVAPKIPPDEQLLADLNRAQQSGDYETAQKITDKIRQDTATTPQSGQDQLLLEPSKPSVTITRISDLQKLSKTGADLSNVTFVAKTTNDARAALKLGLSGNQISPVSKPSKQSGSFIADDSGTVIKIKKQELTPIEVDKTTDQLLTDTTKPKNKFRTALQDTVGSDPKRVISEMGDAGKKIEQIVDKSNEEADLLFGELQNELNNALKLLSKDEQKNFSDYAQNKVEAPNERVQNAVDVWDRQRTLLRQMALESGLSPGFITDYFPRKPTKNLSGDGLIKELVSRGVPLAKAQARVSSFLSRSSERRFGSLDYSRDFPELDYRKDAGVLFDYIRGAATRISNAKNLGVDDSRVYELANQTSDPARAKLMLDQLLGKGDWGGKQTGEDLANAITKVQTVTKLSPLTSLLNLTQNINTAARTDVQTIGKAIAQVLSNPGKYEQEAFKSGEVDTRTAQILGEDYEKSSMVGKYIRLIGMYGSEKFNRMVAVQAGKEYVTKLASQANSGSGSASRELGRIGIKPGDDGKFDLTDSDLIVAGRKMSQITQFSEQKKPYLWRTPLGRVLTQFKGFAYSQYQFLKDDVIKRTVSEATKGNVKPLANTLATYGIAAPIVGTVVDWVTNLVRNKVPESKTYVERILAGTSLGLLDNIPSLLGEYGETGVIGALGGPTSSDIYKYGVAGLAAKAGLENYNPDKTFLENIDPSRKLQRQVVGTIPVVGKTLSNTFIPNASIDNQFGGVNEGLTESNKEIYNSLKSTNPSYAETFKADNKYKPDEGKTSFLDVLSGKTAATSTSTMPTADAPEAVQKKYKAGLTKKVDLGEELTPDEAGYYYLDNQTLADQKTYKDVNDFYSKVIKLQNDKDLSDAAKQNIMYKSGISKPDWEYYQKASGTDEEKLSEALRIATTTEDADAMIAQLIAGKRTIGNKAIFTATQMDYLYDRGLITKQQKALIAAVKYDELLKQFYVDRDYKGSVGGSSGSGGSGSSSGTMSNAKLVSLMKQVYSIFGDEIKQEKSVVKGTSIPKVKSVTSKPLSSILKVRTKASGNKLWFKAY